MAKICIFSLPFHPDIGGLERIAFLVATFSSRSGHEVEVVTASRAVSPEEDRSFSFKITRTTLMADRFRAFRRADVILFMNISLQGLPWALLSLRPIVLSHHGTYRAPGMKNTCLGIAKRAITLFFPNISVSRFVAGFIPGRSTVIANAYDAELFTPASFKLERAKDFVFCGRLVSDKGALLALQAFKEILSEFPEATLSIVGDGPERDVLIDFSTRHSIQGNVEFSGPLDGERLVDTLKKHACMVIPSVWEEPFGIVALEGIACCQTLISSCRGGLPEAVGQCGIVIEPTVENFRDAMLSVMKSRHSGQQLPGQTTELKRWDHLTRHSPDFVSRKYIDVCLKALNIQ